MQKRLYLKNHIKEFHRILKSNTSDTRKDWFKVGEYKLKPNIIGGIETSKPNEVKEHIEIKTVAKFLR